MSAPDLAAIAGTTLDRLPRDAEGPIFREPWDMEGVGRIAIVSDPTGAAVGIMTPVPRPA